MPPIIRVHNLSKQYQLGAASGSYSTIRESLMHFARNPLSGLRRNGDAPTVWALKNLELEIERGDVVGIIGRNGAGKSTFLKILSRITEPTTGRVELYGRVASLLEVGTGFHPELTGRENIFLNGSLLGMTHKEIAAKFDEIVAFSEVEKFIDTPVKRYSSGMYVRLAFAVAAHLEPEILIVDEVLAVGDAAFQKKCLGRMQDVANEGRTVLFVSHNMAAVSALCSKAMVLWQGEVQFKMGPVQSAVQNYLSQVSEMAKVNLAARTDRQGGGKIRITDFRALDPQGNEVEYLSAGQEIEFHVFYTSSVDRIENIVVAIGITSNVGTFVSMLSNDLTGQLFQTTAREGYFVCKIRKLPLAPGNYMINLIVRSNEIIQDWIQEATTIVVEPGDFYGTGRMPPQSHAGMLMEQEWSAR